MGIKLLFRSIYFQASRFNPCKYLNKSDLLNSEMKCLLNKKSLTENSLWISRRPYSLKLYSQFYPDRNLFRNNILNYLKVKHELDVNSDFYNITNFYDEEVIMKQLHSLILHSNESNPDDVLKLFLLYSSCKPWILSEIHNFKNSSKRLHYKIESTIFNMNFEQLYQFAVSLKGLRNIKVRFFLELKHLLLEETWSRVENSESLEEIIRYFLIGYELFGNSIKTKNVYMDYISLLEKFMHIANPIQLCHIFYFAGLAKDKNILTIIPQNGIRLLSANFDSISFVDAGLAISSLFKINLRTDQDIPLLSQIVDKIIKLNETISDNYTLSPLESYTLIAMVKYLRLSLHKESKLLNSMKALIFKLKEESLNPQFISHIGALFANNNQYDAEMFSLIESKFKESLESPEEVLRIKDISRVMWSLSHTQHNCENSTLKLVEDSLRKFSSTGDCTIHPSHVIDSTVALSTYGVYSEELMKTILNSKIYKILQGSNRGRHMSRLLVLHEIKKTVFPDLEVNIPKTESHLLPARFISNEVFHRPCIKQVQRALYWLKKECGVHVFTLKFLIPHINHCSVVLSFMPKLGNEGTDSTTTRYSEETLCSTNEKPTDIGEHILENLSILPDHKISIEINDENTSLNEGTRVNGMETLKRELLKIKGWKVKVVSNKEIEACRDDEEALAALLLQKVNEK